MNNPKTRRCKGSCKRKRLIKFYSKDSFECYECLGACYNCHGLLNSNKLCVSNVCDASVMKKEVFMHKLYSIINIDDSFLKFGSDLYYQFSKLSSCFFLSSKLFSRDHCRDVLNWISSIDSVFENINFDDLRVKERYYITINKFILY